MGGALRYVHDSTCPSKDTAGTCTASCHADAQQQQDPGSSRVAASSRWSSQAGVQPGRRQQPQPQQPHHASARQQGGSSPDAEEDAAAGAGGGGRPGFKSARAQLVTDFRKKGQHQQANMLSHQVCSCRLLTFRARLFPPSTGPTYQSCTAKDITTRLVGSSWCTKQAHCL